jgi:hypothetical protein
VYGGWGSECEHMKMVRLLDLRMKDESMYSRGVLEAVPCRSVRMMEDRTRLGENGG